MRCTWVRQWIHTITSAGYELFRESISDCEMPSIFKWWHMDTWLVRTLITAVSLEDTRIAIFLANVPTCHTRRMSSLLQTPVVHSLPRRGSTALKPIAASRTFFVNNKQHITSQLNKVNQDNYWRVHHVRELTQTWPLNLYVVSMSFNTHGPWQPQGHTLIIFVL